MNKLRRLRSLSPEMAETLRLAGVQGIFWAAMAVGNYQTVYLQSIGFPATDFGLLNAIACAVAIAPKELSTLCCPGTISSTVLTKTPSTYKS